MSSKIFKQLNKLSTEKRNTKSLNIDKCSTIQILQIINNEDLCVAKIVKRELSSIAKAVELVAKAFNSGGRLIYIGAGTSGRLGVLDAAECPPTFGTNPKMVQGIIAGGKKAMFRSQEGAEDNEKAGKEIINKLKIGSNDVVCGIAASLRTPFVISAIIQAKQKGAKTLFITANPKKILMQKEFAKLNSSIDVAICLNVGAEVIMGSTRMKAGTAQKMTLNMITTAAMIKIGKVYQNMMIDLQMTNNKLKERAKKTIMIITGLNYKQAEKYLIQANYNVKTAIVMILAKVDFKEAQERLKNSKGIVHKAINNN